MIFTIGHSNKPIHGFIETLNHFDITTVCDIRSKPSSRFAPAFNKVNFSRLLADKNIRYAFRGKVLGGFGDPNELMREKLIQINDYSEAGNNIVLMCSELNYTDCHRHWWASRYIVEGLGNNVIALKTGSFDSTLITKESFDGMSDHKVGKEYLGVNDIMKPVS